MVSDDQILAAHHALAARDGIYCEPASAASVAGLLAATESGRVDSGPDDRLHPHRARAQGHPVGSAGRRRSDDHRADRAGSGHGPRAVTATAAAVSVPATSANLGSGFDSLGLALELRDHVEGAFVSGKDVRVEVEGEGVGAVPTDAGNLVARVVRTGLATFDPSGELAGRGLALRCINAVPHSRGLGSSAAAIVGGLALAAQLAGVVGPDGVSAEQLVALATRLEGHPDNAAAAVLGGATIAWTHESALGPVGQAVRIDVDPRIRPVVAIPVSQASTAGARGALPSVVPHADAAFNVARAALLSHALSHDPSLLLEATDDRLHQRQRRSVYPESLELVGSLRKRGIAAAISGAGPTVIVLGSDDAGEIARNIGDLAGPSWRVLALRVAGDGVRAA